MARRRVSKYAGGDRGKPAASQANLVKAPPAKRGNKSASRTNVQSRQPELLTGPDGMTLDDHSAQLHAAMVDGGVAHPTYHPFYQLLSREYHHYLAVDHLAPYMSIHAQKVHLRRGKLVMEMLSEMGLTPVSQSHLGLRSAKQMEATRAVFKPVRTSDRARAVAALLQGIGVVAAPRPDVIEAEVVPDVELSDAPAEWLAPKEGD